MTRLPAERAAHALEPKPKGTQRWILCDGALAPGRLPLSGTSVG
jgi:hypothetical protein